MVKWDGLTDMHNPRTFISSCAATNIFDFELWMTPLFGFKSMVIPDEVLWHLVTKGYYL